MIAAEIQSERQHTIAVRYDTWKNDDCISLDVRNEEGRMLAWLILSKTSVKRMADALNKFVERHGICRNCGGTGIRMSAGHREDCSEDCTV